MNERQKHEQIKALTTDALRRIVDHADGEREADHPLSGQVHISGIGQVPVSWLRAELERRTATTSSR